MVKRDVLCTKRERPLGNVYASLTFGDMIASFQSGWCYKIYMGVAFLELIINDSRVILNSK